MMTDDVCIFHAYWKVNYEQQTQYISEVEKILNDFGINNKLSEKYKHTDNLI